MADLPDRAAHLSDADIDAYWMGKLSEADEERVEQHYLDCSECQSRVAAVEALIEGLHAPASSAPFRAGWLGVWQFAAAAFAIAAVGATWQWARLAREPRVAPVPTAVSVLNTAVVPLAPPTRASQRAEVTLAPGVSIVIFAIDAAEAGAPGSRFDVTLSSATGGAVVRLTRIASSPSGVIHVPVERSLLTSGEFAFEVTGTSNTTVLPVLIREADSR